MLFALATLAPMQSSDKYLQRGVSASKEDVHRAIGKLDKGLFEKSFCKIFPDVLGEDDAYCNIMSSDGSGTKSILAYLYWKETGDASVFRGIAQDVVVMNLDDLLCVGATGPFVFSSVINRNKNKINGELIKEIIEGSAAFFELLHQHGIEVQFTGGETADLGDVVKTITVDGTMTTRMPKENIIRTSNIQAGNVIVGLYSHGQATYESEYNSGIGSNGLTSARHDLLNKTYLQKYPETVDESILDNLLYSGKFLLADNLPGTEISIGKALLSPTRSFAPVIKSLLHDLKGKNAIYSLVHCTGGGQGKALHFLKDVKLVLNNFPEIPPVFHCIKENSETTWQEMFRVYNMGVRMQIFTEEKYADAIITLAKSFQVSASVIGHVERSALPTVEIKTGTEDVCLQL